MEPPIERVLVTGATGSIGPALIESLQNRATYIRAVDRRAPSNESFAPDVEFLQGDITSPAFIENAMTGATIVFHLAAMLHIPNPSPDLRQEYERVNVSGTQCIVEAARRHGVRRIIFFSTINVYGSGSGRLPDETTRPSPEGLYAESKLRAEHIVLQRESADGQQLGTVLRSAAVYGPRMKGNYKKLVNALNEGRFIPIGSGRNRRALIYEKDLAAAAIIAAGERDAAGKIFNVSDGQNHTLAEIIEAICSALGKKPPRMHLPAGPVRMFSGMLEQAASLLGIRFPIKSGMVEKYLEDVAVNASRIKAIGFSPNYDLRSGWRETIRKMKEFGELA